MIQALSRISAACFCALWGMTVAQASEARIIELPDGRNLSYREFGNPRGPLVFYFHGLPGSNMEAKLIEDEIRRAGLRVVAVDRPGIAQSTYQPNRTISDWPRDLSYLADRLGYKNRKFGIIAVSGGTPYGCACALSIGHRISHLALVTPFAPPKRKEVEKSSMHFLLNFAARHPNITKLVLSSQKRQLKKNPNKAVKKGVRPFLPEEQAYVLEQPDLKQDFITNLEQALTQGPRGAATEIRLLARPWGIDVSNIQGVSISIWAGGRDEIAPQSMAEYFHRQIAGSRIHSDPDTGHLFTLQKQARRILSRY